MMTPVVLEEALVEVVADYLVYCFLVAPAAADVGTEEVDCASYQAPNIHHHWFRYSAVAVVWKSN